LLLSINLQKAEQHARHLCEEITRAHFNLQNTVSCSFGVVEYSHEMESVLSVLKRADNALYKAKQAGKNCVAIA
jgi:diguanylate cyclase (GGDEF)-like protein